MYKNYFFDLDGTLLPMDMENFIKLYFGSLCKRLAPVLNIEPAKLVDAVWKGTGAMIMNDGTCLNKDAFWKVASRVCGIDLSDYVEQFDDFYLNEFVNAKQATGFTPYSAKCIELIKKNGGRLIAATNPIFPYVATKRRLEWAGLSADDFEFITTYENSGFCKPNLKYYEFICDKCKVKPEESIMIGNDVDEDMCCAELGFDTYLITDCIINKSNKDISLYKNGSFEQFYEFLMKQN